MDTSALVEIFGDRTLVGFEPGIRKGCRKRASIRSPFPLQCLDQRCKFGLHTELADCFGFVELVLRNPATDRTHKIIDAIPCIAWALAELACHEGTYKCAALR